MAARKKKAKKKAARKPKARDKSAAKGGRDTRTGQFLKGCKAGPGRPKGPLNILTICRAEEKKPGAMPLQQIVWSVVKGLAAKAMKGDAAAGRVVLEQLCGKPRPADHGDTLDLLPMATLADTRANMAKLAEAIAAGAYPHDLGVQLLQVLGGYRESILADEVVGDLAEVRERLGMTDGQS